MARSLTPPEVQSIHAALAAGNKIEAIKLYRELTGLGLTEAKAYVEGLAIPAQIPAGEIKPADLAAVTAAIFSGETIQAIKLHRAAHPGMGLKEAKEAVEKMAAELYVKHPGQFTQPPKRAGCAAVFALGFLLPTLAWYLAAR
jgi:ribosomal protein L7/L12